MTKQIEFSDEQAMLLDTAMSFCAGHSDINRVRQLLDEELSFEPKTWQQIVELGWPAILIPEAYGGIGLTAADLVPVMESMGRHLMGTPFLPTTLAAGALLAGGSEQQKVHWLARIASGAAATVALTETDGNWNLGEINATGEVSDNLITLSGTKCFVLELPSAELVVVSVMIDGKPSLVVLEASDMPAGAAIRESVVDDTRRSYSLNLAGIVISTDRLLPEPDFSAIENLALLLVSAEACGGIASTLNLIVNYLNERTQFDHRIGSYQALKHPAVDILLGLETSRALLYHAATQMAGTEVSAQAQAAVEVAVRMAKAKSSEAFAFAGDRAVQFHGGFGFTFECDAQLYLRRALWCQYQFGDQAHQQALLEPLLLG